MMKNIGFRSVYPPTSKSRCTPMPMSKFSFILGSLASIRYHPKSHNPTMIYLNSMLYFLRRKTFKSSQPVGSSPSPSKIRVNIYLPLNNPKPTIPRSNVNLSSRRSYSTNKTFSRRPKNYKISSNR